MDRRYLVLTELFLPTKGGTAVWFDEVYRRLGGKGIHVVTADVPGARAHDRDHPNTIHRLALKRVRWLRPESLGMYAKFFAKALMLAVGQRFDAIHAGRALPEGFVAWCVARLTGHRAVIYAHGEELTTWGCGAKYRAMCFALRAADVVVANSEFTRDLLAGIGVAPDRIRIVHPGVDTSKFRPGLPCGDLRRQIGIGPDTRLILTIGRLQRRKGFDMVISALPGLLANGHDVHCALAGIGEDARYLEALAARLGVSDRVHLLGSVTPEDLPRWLNACDLFAMPNREIDGDNEGFGLVFLEAAACGKPVVAGIDGGTGSAVVAGATGLRVNGKIASEVEAAIDALLADRALIHSMGATARARAERQFDWDHVARKTIELAS